MVWRIKQARIEIDTRRSGHANVEPELRGWKTIAEYLGQPLAVALRWAKSGMPVSRKGRYATASTEDLSRWLGREAKMGAPAHISSGQELGADLRASLAAAKRK